MMDSFAKLDAGSRINAIAVVPHLCMVSSTSLIAHFRELNRNIIY